MCILFYPNCLKRLVTRIAEISDEYMKYRLSSSGGRVSEDPRDARFDVLKNLSTGIVRNTVWPEAFEIFLPKLDKAFVLRMFTDRISEECMIENGEDITSEIWVKKILKEGVNQTRTFFVERDSCITQKFIFFDLLKLKRIQNIYFAVN